MRLQGKAAVITGGANGIGRAIALAYAREGARVTILDRDPKGAETADEIRRAGGRAAFVQVDVSDREALTAAIQNAGQVDILVTSAAILEKRSILESSMEDFDRTMDTNIHGVMNAVQAVIPGMKAQGGGKIINVSSLLGLRNCNAGRIGYCSTKRGIEAMTRAMAAELGPHHIYVNSIAPGTIETNMGGLGALFTDEVIRERSKYIPLRFRGEPEMLVGPALFLASSDSDYVTGTCVIVDGGWCAVD